MSERASQTRPDDHRFTLGTRTHRVWLAGQTEDLFRFYGSSADVRHGGFDVLDAAGVRRHAPKDLYLTARMTYCFALGTLLGRDDMLLVGHGLDALRTIFHDDASDGWFAQLNPDATAVTDSTKATYAHAFVLLAAATASVAGYDSTDLLAEACAVYDRHLWEADARMCVDGWDAGWRHAEDYRGMNANMHTVEAFLAGYEATADAAYLDRAEAISGRLIAAAAGFDWRIPEHFSVDWVARPDYHHDRPADQFRPYGSTPGHGLEWARLLVQLRSVAGDESGQLLAAARGLFDRAVEDAWDEERMGFDYTVDWAGRPVITARLHWPLAEAIGAAHSLYAVTGDPGYATWYRRFWRLADRAYVDHRRGGWHHELTPDGRVSATIWPGKPDLYHALQATLFVHTVDGEGLLTALQRGRAR
jgi:sulfoquinovose isomerase